jgi:hypothetical protein
MLLLVVEVDGGCCCGYAAEEILMIQKLIDPSEMAMVEEGNLSQRMSIPQKVDMIVPVHPGNSDVAVAVLVAMVAVAIETS